MDGAKVEEKKKRGKVFFGSDRRSNCVNVTKIFEEKWTENNRSKYKDGCQNTKGMNSFLINFVSQN